MIRLALSVAMLTANVSGAAAEGNSARFLNRTGETIVHLQLAPAGARSFGGELCKNDDEGQVDHNEKLNLVGVKSGRYDIRLADKKGHVCTVRNIDVREGEQFVLHAQDLTTCGK
ncbi:hypothetical protein SAMN06265338_1393 [Rhodoblastus acidophilus]|uniref:Uncharacterized protein n=1 Tax=Rhodoblastus acidophilus TaxID=1074 RepID=A0A212SGS3_RHOAC|nr:hypothetical protein [Rhodoblastus acidophilus]PPQ34776.1 hypothetical protein CKO16_21940 [Rhodoblastus acidophilus]RAI16585.1 hypothetical protein CH337_20655 [Rhodoblastus acidophilus]SNB84761.1 hypothetical protein SAMN06265338_1393 [Rhodoblastus acidophilus]